MKYHLIDIKLTNTEYLKRWDAKCLGDYRSDNSQIADKSIN